MFDRGKMNRFFGLQPSPKHMPSEPDLCSFIEHAGINEIYGASGVGKSTLAMQLMLNFLSLNTGSSAIYICTESQFSLSRLEQLGINNFGVDVFNKLCDRIYIQHIGDLETQEHYITFFLRRAIEEKNIDTIIIDSISANFRTNNRTNDVNQTMFRMASHLNFLSYAYKTRVICINQVSHGTDHIGSAGWKTKPCLGLSWYNYVSCRLELARDFGGTRMLKCIKSGSLPNRSEAMQLHDGGFSWISH